MNGTQLELELSYLISHSKLLSMTPPAYPPGVDLSHMELNLEIPKGQEALGLFIKCDLV